MWLVFAAAAGLTAIVSVIRTILGKETMWFCVASLSLTVLSLCACMSMIADWVHREDWSALMDTASALSTACWVLTSASILMNGVSLLINKKK